VLWYLVAIVWIGVNPDPCCADGGASRAAPDVRARARPRRLPAAALPAPQRSAVNRPTHLSVLGPSRGPARCDVRLIASDALARETFLPAVSGVHRSCSR